MTKHAGRQTQWLAACAAWRASECTSSVVAAGTPLECYESRRREFSQRRTHARSIRHCDACAHQTHCAAVPSTRTPVPRFGEYRPRSHSVGSGLCRQTFGSARPTTAVALMLPPRPGRRGLDPQRGIPALINRCASSSSVESVARARLREMDVALGLRMSMPPSPEHPLAAVDVDDRTGDCG